MEFWVAIWRKLRLKQWLLMLDFTLQLDRCHREHSIPMFAPFAEIDYFSKPKRKPLSRKLVDCLAITSKPAHVFSLHFSIMFNIQPLS